MRVRWCSVAILIAIVSLVVGWLVRLPRDAATRICFASFWFRDTGTAFTLATSTALRAYLHVCRETFFNLESEARDILLERQAAGTLASLCSVELAPPQGRKRVEAVAPRSYRPTQWRHKQDSELGVAGPSYLKAGVRPMQEATVQPEDVATALEHADIVRFNASAVLPEMVFNISVSRLAASELESGAQIPIGELTPLMERKECAHNLRRLTQLVPNLPEALQDMWPLALWFVSPVVWRVCARQRTLRHAAEWHATSRHHETMPYSALRNMDATEMQTARYLGTSGNVYPVVVVPVQRLSNFPVRGTHAKLLGLHDQVERTRSSLFIGATSGAFHTDIQDNVLMQVTGSLEVFIIPAKYARYGMPVGPLLDWLLEPKYPSRQNIPFFHIELHAGDGVVIPSMSPHRVLAGNSSTIRVNSFLEPRFKKMQWITAPGNAFAHCSDAYLAMRMLWLRSMSRLWEHSSIAPFMQGNSAELL